MEPTEKMFLPIIEHGALSDPTAELSFTNTLLAESVKSHSKVRTLF
jgi:hypothetical protein